MFRNQPKFKIYLLVCDLVIVYGAFLLAIAAMPGPFERYLGSKPWEMVNSLSSYAIFSFIYTFIFFFNNLYKRNITTTVYRQFILILKSLITGTIINLFLLLVFNLDFLIDVGKNIFFLFFWISLLLFTFTRVLVTKKLFLFLSQKGLYPVRVLIVGADKEGRYVAEKLSSDPFSNFQIVGFLDDYKETGQFVYKGHTNLGHIDDLEKVINEFKIKEIIIAIHKAPYTRLIQIAEACLHTGRVVRIYSDLLVIVVNKINVEFYAGIPMVMLSEVSNLGSVYPFKRPLDIVASIVVLVVLSPLFALIALGIKLSSKGPIIFKQTRIGQRGKPFNFYKFRSMHLGGNSEEHKAFVQNFIKGNISDGHEKQGNNEIKVFKIKNDPRIFPFGRFIRKTSLDEFPQFFNVLKGEMSLVGPRPCLPYEWEAYETWHQNRLNCLPGCTGIWQALGRSSVSFKEMVILDLYYLSNMSIFLDIRIMLKTFPVIFFGHGAF